MFPEAAGLHVLVRHCGLRVTTDGPLPTLLHSDSTVNPGGPNLHVFLHEGVTTRITALHLCVVPLRDTFFQNPMHEVERLKRMVSLFRSTADSCTACPKKTGCRMLTILPLLEWALRFTRDYAARGYDDRDNSRLSGRYTTDAPSGMFLNVRFFLAPYLYVSAIHKAFDDRDLPCSTF